MTDIESLVRAFYERLWNAWDDDAVDEVLSPDFAFRGSLGTRTAGRDGWRGYRDSIRTASPDFHNEIDMLVVADASAAARLTYTGTHAGTLLGHPATGRRFSYSGAAFFTADSGRLASAWVLGDIASLEAQLR